MRKSLLSLHRQPSEEVRKLKSAPIPDGEVRAAAVADMTLDEECILERSRIVSTATARMPYIGLCGKYNKRWYVDVVALPHDSIRTLLQHMFSIATAVQRLVLDMTAEDFDKAFAFAGELDRYMQVVLEAEEKILYPMVDGALKKVDGYLEHALHPGRRAATKERVRVLLGKMVGRDIRADASVAIATEWRRSLDGLSRELLEYFAVKEEILPAFVQMSIRGSREKKRLERHLLRFFSECGAEFHYAALLTCPFHLEGVRADFEERHFPREKRAQYRAAVAHVNDVLFEVARSFDRASEKYEAKFSMQTFLTHYGQVPGKEGEIMYVEEGSPASGADRS